MLEYTDLNLQYINGSWRKGAGTAEIDVMNPYTQQSVTRIQPASQHDIDEAYESAKTVQKEWAEVNAFEKARIMEKAVHIMEERREELIRVLVEDAGSTRIKANVEVDFTIAITRHSAAFPMRMGGEMPPSIIPGKKIMYTANRWVLSVSSGRSTFRCI